jgi:hypothetical protein
MKAAGDILLGFIGPIRTTEMDSIHMDPVDPMPAWEKGMLLADLTEETVDTLLAAAGPQLDIPLIMVELRLMGRRPAQPNAVAGRSGAYSLYVIGPAVPELAQVVPAIGKGVLGALTPWRAEGSMVNFLGDVTGPEEVAAAYEPGAFERLRAVKQRIDPAGVFTFGHAI